MVLHVQIPPTGRSLSVNNLSQQLQAAPAAACCRKAWRRAYDRVAPAAPYLLGPGERRDDRRSTEKRRFLLEDVRNHLAEVRPAMKPAAVRSR